METSAPLFDDLVRRLVPSLSSSLAEQFSVFRVMHHGTHEKQISNVFAWLLDPSGTHELGGAFQRIFADHVNRSLPEVVRVPDFGYEVQQEVDTVGAGADVGKDIADIVLAASTASIVVENFESSDGHGHDFQRYLAYGALGGKQSVVVLLCARHEIHRQQDGWEQAIVITYSELIQALQVHVNNDGGWRRTHPQQNFFITELMNHFVEGPMPVNKEEQIAFLDTMCQTGEAARYGYRPIEVAAQEFAAEVAQHALHQFHEGRALLREIKATLKSYTQRVLASQISQELPVGQTVTVKANYQGKWEWCIIIDRSVQLPKLYILFGPTAAAQNQEASTAVTEPDYTRLFVSKDAHGNSPAVIHQSAVTLSEVLAGPDATDTRLLDDILALIET